MNIDPVSGNPVPPGATAKEVRDDVPIRASENEYIIPANVVRYLGLDYIEKMINKAKEGLAELEANGRIGGQEAPPAQEPMVQEDAAPAPMMAAGGMVAPQGGAPASGNMGIGGAGSFTGMKQYTGPNGSVMFIPVVNGQPSMAIPPGYVDSTQQTPQPQANQPTPNNPYAKVAPQLDHATPGERQQEQAQRGLNVNNWGYDDVQKFSGQVDAPQRGLVDAAFGALPGGGIAKRARDNYLANNVPSLVDKMISTGMDPRGTKLSKEQTSQLSATREKLATHFAENKPEKGFVGKALDRVSEAFGIGKQNKSTPSASSTKEKSTTSKSTKSAPSKNSMPDKPTSFSKDKTEKKERGYAAGGLVSAPTKQDTVMPQYMAKGGLITRKTKKQC